jgi:hypothetical protein
MMDVDTVRARLEELRDRRSDTLAVDTLPVALREYIDDVLRCSGITIVGLTADIVLDLVHWLDGRDRRRVPARLEGLPYLVQIGRMK